jgi:putative ABC transport system permease protein
MLKLTNVTKKYHVGDVVQVALNGVDMEFRQNEFVAILGPSGCGKTTSLNIIGGLDRYDSGDLVINGKSTKDFTDSEWDAYRNNSIGFVFQSYNLISHISVLDNVEMGMTLSGFTAEARKKRALEVLERVGLSDHITKRPNQLSGGQQQRVAIARALANDPDIILADEPTGAIDSKTSQQIMDLITEIAKDKLVIMVTHNSEIAKQYAGRIIRMMDGKVIDDTRPIIKELESLETYTFKKTSMSFIQAMKLSFNNLKTKIVRTLITAFAGSIGIIGIALILALSNGLEKEIDVIEGSTLAEMPLMINQIPRTFGPEGRPDFHSNEPDPNEYPSGSNIAVVDPTTQSTTHTNVITEEYITYLNHLDESLYNNITYRRSLQMNLLLKTQTDAIINVNNSRVGWSELPENMTFFQSQYDLLAGSYPADKQQLLLTVDSYNNLNLSLVNALGLTSEVATLDFEDFLGLKLKLILNNDFYHKEADQVLYSIDSTLSELYNSPDAVELTVTGIVRLKEGSSSNLVSNGISYLPQLTDFVLVDSLTSDIAIYQEASDFNVLSGQPLTATEKTVILSVLGFDATPNMISIYAKGFEEKKQIKLYLDAYNSALNEEDVDKMIIYTDLAESITKVVGDFVSGISYVLIAFSAISLVVSSIMIGIITYVSVLERTKEIGILRSLGARKKDISRVFNAEAIIIGFVAGTMGVVLAFLLTFPINAIIGNLVEGMDQLAQLPFISAILLIVVSVSLTFVSGLIPSRIASRKNPVEALRTE